MVETRRTEEGYKRVSICQKRPVQIYSNEPSSACFYWCINCHITVHSVNRTLCFLFYLPIIIALQAFFFSSSFFLQSRLFSLLAQMSKWQQQQHHWEHNVMLHLTSKVFFFLIILRSLKITSHLRGTFFFVCHFNAMIQINKCPWSSYQLL